MGSHMKMKINVIYVYKYIYIHICAGFWVCSMRFGGGLFTHTIFNTLSKHIHIYEQFYYDIHVYVPNCAYSLLHLS